LWFFLNIHFNFHTPTMMTKVIIEKKQISQKSFLKHNFP
jgi:hypothetical protein